MRSQQNAWLAAHARLVKVQAQYAVGPVTGRLLHAANLAAIGLEGLGSGQAANAHLLAGRVALDLGQRAEADRHLAAAARSRRRGPAMARATGWLGEALRADAAGQPRRLLAACRRGLEVLDKHRFTLGASELRARPPRMVLSWPHSPSAMPRGPVGHGSSSPGPSAGGPRRWPCPRYDPGRRGTQRRSGRAA